jgi:hypothetical protein
MSVSSSRAGAKRHTVRLPPISSLRGADVPKVGIAVEAFRLAGIEPRARWSCPCFVASANNEGKARRDPVAHLQQRQDCVTEPQLFFTCFYRERINLSAKGGQGSPRSIAVEGPSSAGGMIRSNRSPSPDGGTQPREVRRLPGCWLGRKGPRSRISLTRITAFVCGKNASATAVVPPICSRGSCVGLAKTLMGRRDMARPISITEQNGAGEGIRTLDPNLGKVVLYP